MWENPTEFTRGKARRGAWNCSEKPLRLSCPRDQGGHEMGWSMRPVEVVSVFLALLVLVIAACGPSPPHPARAPRPNRASWMQKPASSRRRKHRRPSVTGRRSATSRPDRRPIAPADLRLEQHPGHEPTSSLKEAREAAEKQIIRSALRRNRNNLSQAAKELQVSRMTLYRLLSKHQIERGG